MTSVAEPSLTLVLCQGSSADFCRAHSLFVLASGRIRVKAQTPPSSQWLSKVNVETERCVHVSKNQAENLNRGFTLSFPSNR